MRRALWKLASFVDPPTVVASVAAAYLSTGLLWTGFFFELREFSNELTLNNAVAGAYLLLAVCTLFMPLRVDRLAQVRRGLSVRRGDVSFTWFVFVPASLVLLWSLLFVQVPHADPDIVPFWFVSASFPPLMAIGDGLIWLVGLLTGGGLR